MKELQINNEDILKTKPLFISQKDVDLKYGKGLYTERTNFELNTAGNWRVEKDNSFDFPNHQIHQKTEGLFEEVVLGRSF